MRFRTKCLTTATTAFILITTLPTLAQQPQSSAEPANAQSTATTTTTTNDDPLSGPKINRGPAAPGVAIRFTKTGRRRYDGPRANFRIYRRILEKINLTETQTENLKSIYQHFQSDTRDYYKQHQNETDKLRAELRKAAAARLAQATAPITDQKKESSDQRRRPQQQTRNPNATDVKMTPAMERARNRLREINAGKPSPEPYLIETWNALTPDQQTQFQSQLKQLHAETQASNATNDGKSMRPGTSEQNYKSFAESRRAFIEQLLDKEKNQLTDRERMILERLRDRLNKSESSDRPATGATDIPPSARDRRRANQPPRQRFSRPQPPKAKDIEIEKDKPSETQTNDDGN